MTHRYQKALGIIVVLLIWSATITMAQTSHAPIDDAYVEQGTHSAADLDKIHGEEDPDRLWVRAATTLDRKTYMKFDLTDMSGTVSGAVLEFTVDVAIGAPDVHMVHVYALDEDSWSEDQLTGNNAPARGSEIAVVEVAPQASTDDDQTYQVDLTEYINSVLADDKVASIVFANPTAATGDDADQTDVRFFSAEAAALGPPPQLLVSTGTAVDQVEVPTAFTVSPSYPNPFNSTTNIAFEAPAPGHLQVAVYDVLGREVASLFEGQVSAGRASVTWDGLDKSGRGVSAGLYITRLEYEDHVRTTVMTLVR